MHFHRKDKICFIFYVYSNTLVTSLFFHHLTLTSSSVAPVSENNNENENDDNNENGSRDGRCGFLTVEYVAQRQGVEGQSGRGRRMR